MSMLVMRLIVMELQHIVSLSVRTSVYNGTTIDYVPVSNAIDCNGTTTDCVPVSKYDCCIGTMADCVPISKYD